MASSRKWVKYVDEELYMSLAEAMRELGVTQSRIRGLVEVGRMRYVLTSSKLYVLREDVAALKEDPKYTANLST